MPRDDERDDLEHTGYRSGRVRIIGAEPAGRSAAMRSEDDVREPWNQEESEDVEDAPPADGFVTPPLPHWTEPATGEMPESLSAGSDRASSDPFASLQGPSWREEGADWEAQDEDFEPSMLASDQTGAGSLDTGPSDRQPWVFDLPGTADAESRIFGDEPDWGEAEPEWEELALAPSPAGWGDEDEEAPITEVIPVVGRTETEEPDHAEPAGAGFPGVAMSSTAVPTEEPDELFIDDEPPIGEALVVVDDLDTVIEEPRSRFRSFRSADRRSTPERAPAPPPKAPGPTRRTPASSRFRPPPGPEAESPPRNVAAAIVSGIVIGGLALIAFKIGPVVAVGLVTVVATMAAAEAFAAFRHGGYHPVTLLGLVATMSLMIATYNRGQAALPLVFVLLVVGCFVWHLAGVESTDTVRSIGTTLFVFGWVAVFGSFAALLLSPTQFPDRHGIAFLLGGIIAAVSYDVGALMFGAWLGRHPMASVSPNKTWEGFVGGLVTCLIFSVVIVHLIHPWTVGKAAALALVVSVVSTLGDLFESTVKRHLGRKDMGQLLPGHGGLLDRVDGLLFVLPATYYLVIAFHLT